jgi:succinate dehydrogenase / fumarate reductase membrane anchor subunit
MITTATSLGRTGLQDWLIQRLSAIVMVSYMLFMVVYLLLGKYVQGLHYESWRFLFANPTMRLASLIMLLSLVAHAWVGLWMVSTDYIKSVILRLALQILVAIYLFSNLVWGITILWSV